MTLKTEIRLAYGPDSVGFAFDTALYEVLGVNFSNETPLTDIQLGHALDNPIDSLPLDEVVSSGESVLIVVSDATRATASAQIINLLVRRLIQAGTAAGDVAIIFATGIHRPVTLAEKSELLTPFIVQRVRTIDHDAHDPSALVSLGTTDRGTPVEVNRSLKEFTHVIITGAIGFHYFAGFTGGRKSICPGLASSQTIEATHMLAMDFETGSRRSGVGTGLLEGNAVHEECERVAALVQPSFSISSVVDERGRAVQLYAGEWRSAHKAGCREYLSQHSRLIHDRRDVVIVSCGGSPYDINLIQAHKALDMAALACNEGGTIVLVAECADGLGRSDFLKWFTEKDSRALADRLRNEYEVNGQTAWALMTKAERFRIHLVSSLPADQVHQMRMLPATTIGDALHGVDGRSRGYIMPRGTALLPQTNPI